MHRARIDIDRVPLAGDLTKAALGAGYLVVTALGLLGGLLSYLFLTFESTLVLAIGATAGVLPFVTICYVGVTALQADLPEDFAWTIATWFAGGLSVATLFGLAMGLGWGALESRALVQFLIVTTIATGSIIGALVGTVFALKEHHEELHTVHQRNTVMNRVLRHNIRNDINVIQAHATMLADEADGHEAHTDVIKRKSREILSLSTAARDVDALEAGADPGPVDLGDLARDYVDLARDRYPNATIGYDGPDSCDVATGTVVRSVLDNLVENAVTHHDGDPEIAIELARNGDDTVELRVRDDGPGIPDDQFQVLFQDGEDRSHHGSGLGLWLVKWFADRHDGALALEDNEPRGSVVCLELPLAEPGA